MKIFSILAAFALAISGGGKCASPQYMSGQRDICLSCRRNGQCSDRWDSYNNCNGGRFRYGQRNANVRG